MQNFGIAFGKTLLDSPQSGSSIFIFDI